MRNESAKYKSTVGSRYGSRKKTRPALSPAQARKKKEKTIMIVMIVLAVVMVIAAAGVLLYNRWVKKPPLPPDTRPSGTPVSTDPLDSPDPEEIGRAHV